MSEYHDKQSKQFLIDYSEVLPIVSELRTAGFSMQQIANELNKLGYLTREQKPFSSVQVLRILQRAGIADPSKTGAQESVQNAALESQVQSELEQLKSEICTLKTQVEELQQELSDLKSQVFELKQEIELKKVNYSEIHDTSQAVEMRTEPARQSTAKPPRQVDSEMKKVVLQQANVLSAENVKLSENDRLSERAIARLLSDKFNVKLGTVRYWLKKE